MVNISSLLTTIMEKMREVNSEVYYDVNPRENREIIYPYATITTSLSRLNPNQDGFNLDIMIFDRPQSLKNLIDFETNLINHLEKLRLFKDDYFLQFRYLRSNSVPAADSKLKRRNLQFYVKTDWRK